MESGIMLVGPVLLDLIFGDPYNIPHPIVYIGKLIKFLEKKIRKMGISLKIGGLILLTLSITLVLTFMTLLLYLLNMIHPSLKLIGTIYLLYTSLAAKCLSIEVKKVYRSLKDNNILDGRKYISYLVGRNTEKLDYNEITRAAVETTAENTIDGVLGPIFFIVLGLWFGLPVQFVYLYKTVNTLDSMVGYVQEPYKEIGFFSAKTDDILNYIPARIGSIFMILGGFILGFNLKNGIKILFRDRKNHKSPNCAYPEGAVAGLLEIEIGGVNQYFNERTYKPTIGDPIKTLTINNITDTIKIMYLSEILLVIISVLLILGGENEYSWWLFWR